MDADADAGAGADAGMFRLNCQRMLLTYKTHLDKEDYIVWAGKRFKTQGIDFIRLAHETGDEECPYEHTHIVIELKKRCNFKSPRCLDYENIHPHIKMLPNKKALDDAKLYISKEDPENADLLATKTPLYTKVIACKTLAEALEKHVEKATDASGIIQMFKVGTDGNYRRRTRRFDDITLRPWQLTLSDMLTTTPNDRDVIWVFDDIGNTGKSWFAKYMCQLHPTLYRRSTDMGTSRDAATIIEGELQSGWEAWGLFINMARQAEHHSRMYQYFENIKDGQITTQKYQGRSLEFDEPHLIIFANWPPRVRELSLDRWKIFEIVDMELVPVDTYALLKTQEDDGYPGFIDEVAEE